MMNGQFLATLFPTANRFFIAIVLIYPHFGRGADWPQWRYGAGHGAVTPDALPQQLHLQWSRQLEEARPSWPTTQSKLGFDLASEPIVSGGRLFVPSSLTGTMTAYDTKNGKELWRFYAEGAVRFAPVASKGKVWFVSDDGHLYCLRAQDGKLLWKFNGGPSERWSLGHGRLVSTWPARGGPVYRDGKIWFTASIWPFMGIFVHCLEAETGQVLWTNSGEGMNYTVQPHGAPSFATVAPQGHLTLAGNRLIVPGGRSTPAVFQADTGKLEHFKYDKKRGHYRVYAGAEYYFVDKGRYQITDGKNLGESSPKIIGDNYTISQKGDKLTAQKLVGQFRTRTTKNRKGETVKETKFEVATLWSAEINKSAGEIFLQAGDRLYAGAEDQISSFDLADLKDGKPVWNWSAKIKGAPWTMLAADERLFVVTQENQIFCFGAKKIEPTHHSLVSSTEPVPEIKPTDKLQIALSNMAGKDGFALLLGADKSSVDALLNHTKLHLMVVDSDSVNVATLRRHYDAAGQYGERVSIFYRENPANFPVAPYFADLVLVQQKVASELKLEAVERVYESVRPYGGVLCLLHKSASVTEELSTLPQLQVKVAADNLLVVIRKGALPGAADWTHQYADAGQSVVSRDKRVKAPLGLLWFGGPSNAKILPRHGHGPSPQVAGGRLVIEGADILRAVDVYTGRMLWERELKDVGEYYNTTRHFAGAGEVGSNYVTLADAVYVVYRTKILELDIETGSTKKEFSLPDNPNFGWLSVQGDYLVTTVSPLAVKLSSKDKSEAVDSRFASGSRQLTVFNRKTGKLLWKRDAKFNFRHNNIALGANTIYVIDSLTEDRLKALSRRGMKPKGNSSLSALDIKTGRVIWQTQKEIFGTFLNYSIEHDLLLQAGSAFRDRARDDIGKGMIAYQGRSGEVLWANRDLSYSGPCLLLKNRIITNGNGGFALDIKTGKPTGWKYTRNYGCNTAIGSEHLLTFRSGAAGFYDLSHDGGTGNWGGFRSSCTANLIPANGILNAPDYTRTCNCAYQMQTSLGLIHMPQLEYWTFGAKVPEEEVAINFGAPGDRRGPEGKMWLDFPEAGSPSVKMDIKIEPKSAEVFRHHSSRIKSGELKWVGASGLEGVEQVTIKLEDNGQYRVKLHFTEPKYVEAGQRVFDVSLQDEKVLENLDIAQATGGKYQGIAREFNVNITNRTLKINLESGNGAKPVLCGVQWVKLPAKN